MLRVPSRLACFFFSIWLWLCGWAAGPVWGQAVCGLAASDRAYTQCLTGYSSYEDNIHADTVVNDLLVRMKAPQYRFIVKTCPGIENAAAVNINGIPYILLDVTWMESLKPERSDWFHLFVIGHEIGHHLLGHTSGGPVTFLQQRERELAADQFAGYALGTYGIGSDQVSTLLQRFPDDYAPTSTHPGNALRLAAVRRGVAESRASEGNTLLQSLTHDAVLDLKSLPVLVEKARSAYRQYLITENKATLQESVRNYQQAIRFSSAPHLLHELAAVFIATGEPTRYVQTLEYLFSLTKEADYLLEAADFYSFTGSPTAQAFVQQHAHELNNLSLLPSLDGLRLTAFAKHHLLRLQTNPADNEAWLPALHFALQALINRSNPSDTHEVRVLAEAHSALGLLQLRTNEFRAARDNFQLTKDYFAKLQQTEKSWELLFKYFSHNQVVVLSNLTLASIRLQDWPEAQQYVEELDKVYRRFITANPSERPAVVEADISYYRGRAFQGMKQYEQAVGCYSRALGSKPEAYLFYYRGLCQLNLAQPQAACADFQKACALDGTLGCDRVPMLCH
jgi:tetratricopeptide (TPR) repeat protein